MEASSITHRILVRADFRDWGWWQLPKLLRAYVGAVIAAAVALEAYAASQTSWRLSDLGKFLLLLVCGMVSVVATPRIAYAQGALVRDFVTVWVLPVAILLPPFYAMVMPIPLYVLTQWRVHKGVVYRRVFTAAAIGTGYGAASLVFRLFPSSFAGGTIGTGVHALTWAVAVAACEIIGGRSHRTLILAGIKLSDPKARLIDQEISREALQGDLAEFDLGVMITIVVAISPVLAVFAVPTVLLIRRFLMHEQLLAKSRIDTKTGLLNASTWETEATVEVARAIRTHSPLAMALIDIDHFKLVNDTHGHLVGDTVLRAVTDAIQEHLRSYDLAGRFGGEEFVVLLPQARAADAVNIAERLRTHIAAMAIPVVNSATGGEGQSAAGDAGREGDKFVRLTISVGVAALNDATRELTDLMSAADAALYFAKQTGRNKTHAHVPASDAVAGSVVTGSLGAEESPALQKAK